MAKLVSHYQHLISPFFFAIALLVLFLLSNRIVFSALSQCVVDQNGGLGSQYASIQAAITDPACSTIQIRPGVYQESLLITRNLSLYGSGANVTIIDGKRESNVIHIVSATVTISGVTIEKGFTIRNGGGILNEGNLSLISATVQNNYAGESGGGIDSAGQLTLTNSTIFNNISSSSDSVTPAGGGIHTHENSTTLLTNTLIISNSAVVRSGGGIDNQGNMTLFNSEVTSNTATNASGGGITSSGNLTITQSKIQNNRSVFGGGISAGSANFILRDNLITGNFARSEGAGVRAVSGDDGNIIVRIERNQIANNTAGKDQTTDGNGSGLYLGFGYGITSSVSVNGNFITNNRASNMARGGGVMMEGRSISFTNNIVVANTAGFGGGIHVWGGSNEGTSWLINNTIVGNQGTGIVFTNAFDLHLHLSNNLISRNTKYGLSTGPEDLISHMTISHNNLWANQLGNYDGITNQTALNGNLSVPDALVDPPNDWHLSGCSLLMDAGNNLLAPLTDFEGDRRPQNGIVDIGADEYIGESTCLHLFLPIAVAR